MAKRGNDLLALFGRQLARSFPSFFDPYIIHGFQDPKSLGVTVAKRAAAVRRFEVASSERSGFPVGTPLAEEGAARCAVAGADQVPASERMTYKVIALARILCPQANIPSTTALATLNLARGREQGLERGANVIMPNLTPLPYRVLYEIYPAKACLRETPQMCHACLRIRIESIGRKVGVGRGDSPRYQGGRPAGPSRAKKGAAPFPQQPGRVQPPFSLPCAIGGESLGHPGTATSRAVAGGTPYVPGWKEVV